MRQIKFIAVLVLLLAMAAGFYYFTTNGTRDAAQQAEEAVDQELMHEEAPADTSAVADTLGIH